MLTREHIINSAYIHECSKLVMGSFFCHCINTFARAYFCDFLINAGEGNIAEAVGVILYGECGGVGFEEFQHGFE